MRAILRTLLAAACLLFAANAAWAAVDLNTADEQALRSLKGVGAVRAKAIVEERQRNGPYQSIDDVVGRVKGIGPATVAQWKKDGSASALQTAPAAVPDVKH
jgi:competence protein ComEA